MVPASSAAAVSLTNRCDVSQLAVIGKIQTPADDGFTGKSGVLSARG
jgi:hypothetical protein